MKEKRIYENEIFKISQNDNGLYNLEIKTYMQDVCAWIIEQTKKDKQK